MTSTLNRRDLLKSLGCGSAVLAAGAVSTTPAYVDRFIHVRSGCPLVACEVVGEGVTAGATLSGARSAGTSAPATGEAVAAGLLKGAADAAPVSACASAAGRCKSASAEESTTVTAAVCLGAPPSSARCFAPATTCFNRSIFCSFDSPGTGPVSTTPA